MKKKHLLTMAVALAAVLSLIFVIPVAADNGRDPGAEPGIVVSDAVPASGDVGEDNGDNEIYALDDQQILDDLIVNGSACVGLDCVNGESFGFDTIRLKENNLRLKFDDTSTSASFPRNDWQLTANETSNGGLNKFSVDDVTAGRTPFTLEAGAPSHSLYVDDGGRIGLGTSQPVVELHVVDGDTPTLRLEQNGSSGFTPQTWDVAGNEANFFVRDTTNGSKLPFKIIPNADSNNLVIRGTGVFIGANTEPAANLHVLDNARVAGTGGSTRLTVSEESTTTANNRVQLQILNNGAATLRFTDSNDIVTRRWDLENENGGSGFTINDVADNNVEFLLNADGSAVFLGDVTANSVLLTSDFNAKTRFRSINAKSVLDAVNALDVSTWAFKSDLATRHIGPMAQQWNAIMGWGSSPTKINQTDVNGVLLASIQALSAENASLEARLADLEAQLGSLMAALG